MEIKLDYIPKKLYGIFQNDIIEYINNNPSEIKFKFPMFDNYKHILFDNELGKNDYVGVFRSKDKSFTLNDGFYLTKKEAYDAYVKLLEQEIEDKNNQAFNLQMEALDLIGDLNIFMETYEKEIEL